MEFRKNLEATRIDPVIVIKQLGHAVPLAKALVEGGKTATGSQGLRL